MQKNKKSDVKDIDEKEHTQKEKEDDDKDE
jgi:hypothetical protein